MASRTFSINFVGDVMLGRLIDQLFPTHVHEPMEAKHVSSFVARNPQLHDYGPQSPWGTVLPLFQDSHLNVINLETSVTKTDKKWPDKVFNYRMHPVNLKALHPAKIDYVSLANNHTLDFSETGLEDTLEALNEVNVNFAGAGIDKDAAMSPSILSLPRTSVSDSTNEQQHCVAIWSAADHPSDWAKVPGFNLIDYSPQTRVRLKDVITHTSPKNVSLRVFSVHWGPNYAWRPADEIRSLAHYLVDECDIDIVHGHSSHHIQGVEKYKGKLIMYGCGDFIDDYALTPEYRNDLSAVWRVSLRDEGNFLSLAKLEVFPTKIKRFQAHQVLREDEDYDWFHKKFKALCEGFDTVIENEIGTNDQIIIKL